MQARMQVYSGSLSSLALLHNTNGLMPFELGMAQFVALGPYYVWYLSSPLGSCFDRPRDLFPTNFTSSKWLLLLLRLSPPLSKASLRLTVWAS